MPQTELSVPDMSCGHCKTAVETALTVLPGVGEVSVDLAARRIVVSGTTAPKALCDALDAAGYPATVLG